MTFLCDNPWIFHRDEIDLLEEEIDELYRRHGSAAQDLVSQMESRVLKEQLDTEERAEAELTLQIGPEYLLSEGHRIPPEASQFTESSLTETLRMQAYRDPLYERIYLWTQEVFAFTTKQYVTEHQQDEDLFRVHLNVKMIPIKLIASQTERLMGDAMGDQIAQKEQTLCLTYFQRTLDSLQHRAFLGDEMAAQLFKKGKELERLVRGG